MQLQEQVENLIRQTGDMSARQIAAHFPCLKRDGGRERNNRVGRALASLILRDRIELIEENVGRYVYRWNSQSSSVPQS